VVRYQDERPDWVAASAWARGSLTPLELLRVAAWKTGQGLGWLSLNTEQDISTRTAAAIEHIRPWRGTRMASVTDDHVWASWRESARAAVGMQAEGRGLLGLSGVGYPMATAILDILDPDAWPVMDKWAVETVFGTRQDGAPLRPARWQRADAYAVYARHLATAGSACWGADLTIHHLDQRAMRASMKGGQIPPGWYRAAIPDE
jgi:hypothetical protein